MDTTNLTVNGYGQSLFIYSLNTSSVAYSYKGQLVISIKVKFHKFDGIALVAKNRKTPLYI